MSDAQPQPTTGPSIGVGQAVLDRLAQKSKECRYDDDTTFYRIMSGGLSPDRVDAMVEEACREAMLDGMMHASSSFIDASKFTRYLADTIVRDINGLEGFTASVDCQKHNRSEQEWVRMYQEFRECNPRAKSQGTTYNQWLERQKTKPDKIFVCFVPQRGRKRKSTTTQDPTE